MSKLQLQLVEYKLKMETEFSFKELVKNYGIIPNYAKNVLTLQNNVFKGRKIIRFFRPFSFIKVELIKTQNAVISVHQNNKYNTK